MNAAEEIRAAAEKLRAATFRGAMTATPTVAAMLRARGPLADWLDAYATQLAASTHPGWQETTAGLPLAVARAINTRSRT